MHCGVYRFYCEAKSDVHYDVNVLGRSDETFNKYRMITLSSTKIQSSHVFPSSLVFPSEPDAKTVTDALFDDKSECRKSEEI
mmetsp:Transcript_16456/g.42469  ORF Transcript_16456/g.42469 Transcript_16456/m.42469 type:complete len:82 (+) Transcript_16456:403-648(+)